MAASKNQKTLLAAGSGIAGVYAIYRYRKNRASSTSTSGLGSGAAPATTSLTSAVGGISPYTPQSPSILQPGESIYDPNSEGLFTAPGGTSVAPGNPSTSNPPAQGVSPGAPSYTVNINNPPAVSTKPPRLSSLSAAQRKAGDIALPYGPKKPTAPAGYTAVGTGKGNWIGKK